MHTVSLIRGAFQRDDPNDSNPTTFPKRNWSTNNECKGKVEMRVRSQGYSFRMLVSVVLRHGAGVYSHSGYILSQPRATFHAS